MPPSEEDDLALIARCREADGAAFDALYARHAPRVMAYLLRSGFARCDADDLTQETFLRAYKSLETFDAERGTFGPWLGAVARNVARRHWSRRKQPEHFDPDLAEDIFACPGGRAEDLAMANEQCQAVRDCVESLPAELQQMVRLRYVEGRTTRGVGRALDMPEATVRLRLSGAHGMLRRCLREKGFEV